MALANRCCVEKGAIVESLIALCRSGYESVLVDELTHCLASLNVAGYGQFQKQQGWVEFHLLDQDQVSVQRKKIESALGNLIFARQIWWKWCDVGFSDKQDRVGDVLKAIENSVSKESQFDDVLVEYPDTEAGKDVAKFAKKFTVPLRQALRAKSIVKPKNKQNIHPKKALRAHLLLLNFESAVLGYSIVHVTSADIGGIVRLKFPSASPSRSTLKLEDAIVNMLSVEERERVFYAGSNAVDLGACPGGWTYQLVQRGMHVEAIDNGDIAPSLMATGLVEHHAADGFTYKPAYGHVTLLVCDMIEQPDRVAKLMCHWLDKGLADHAIFNLKLPMKQRFETVSDCLALLQEQLNQPKTKYRIETRHLYHDRDEVTVCAIKM
jgi:23S rRNA (cytidine2498-2'-O)-methyltransferase